MWLELARLAEVQTDRQGRRKDWIYIANAFTTDNEPE